MNQELKIKNFQDLKAWQEAHHLVLDIYKVTTKFPKEEQFGLTSQIRRAGISVSSNIAEGFSRHSYKDKAQFYSMALGSLTEVENQVIIARDINYVSRVECDSLIARIIIVNKLINGLIKKSREIHNNS